MDSQTKPKLTHWNFGQMEKWWKSGDSKTKRYLTRKVFCTSFHDDAILDLISIREKFVCWEKKPNKHHLLQLTLETPIGRRLIELDIGQRDYAKILGNIHHMIIDPETPRQRHERVTSELFPTWKKFCAMPEAQGFFDFTVTHELNLGPILERFTEMSHKTFTGENLKKVIGFIADIGICYSAKWDSKIIALVLLKFFLSCDIPVDSANDAVKIVCTCLPVIINAFTAPCAQSNADFFDKDVVTAIATIVSVFTGSMLIKSVPNSSQISDFVASATKFGNFMRAMDNSWKGLSKIIEYLYDRCFEYFMGYPKNIASAKQYIDEVEKWFLEVTEYCSNKYYDDIQVDPVVCRNIERLYIQGMDIEAQAIRLKLDMNLRRTIENCQRNIRSLNDKVSRSGAFKTGPKVEPLIIQLWGETGVGKSGMVYYVAGDILKAEAFLCENPDIDLSDTWTNQIYTRCVEQVFACGYRDQPITLYDDFGQIRDSIAKPNLEFMEMIRYGNLMPYPLHMAALEEKNNTFFQSKCVILTSNCRTYQVESLISPEAFHRRIDVSVEVSIKDEYKKPNGQLDTDKVNEKFGVSSTTDVYLCRIWINGEPSPIWIDYDGLQAALTIAYCKKMNRHFQLTANVTEHMKKPLKVDLSMFKKNKEFKKNSPEHYTLTELRTEKMPEVQSDGYDLFVCRECFGTFTQSEMYSKSLCMQCWKLPRIQMNDEFYDCSEAPVFKNCTKFPKRLMDVALANRKTWKDKVFSYEEESTEQYLVFIENKKLNWHLKFDEFSDSLLSALANMMDLCPILSAKEAWKEVLKFLSIHAGFLTLKTQIALANPLYNEILSTPETAIDFFKGNVDVCLNSECWHPDVNKDSFGFQEGCQTELIHYMRAHTGLTHRYMNLYDDFITFVEIKKNTYNKIKSLMQTKFQQFKSCCNSWLDNVAKWLSEHSEVVVWTGVVGFYIALIGTVVSLIYGGTQKELHEEIAKYKTVRIEFEKARTNYITALENLRAAEMDLKVTTHEHEGMELGKKYKHAHSCENCGMTFTHEHVIKTVDESVKYKHLCKPCRISSEFQSGDNVTSRLAKPTTEFQSGDSITARPTKPTTEFQSGDSVTARPTKPTTEFQSGDNVTTNNPRPKVENDVFAEFLKEVMLESNVEDENFLSDLVSKQVHNKDADSQLAIDPNAMTIGKKVFANTYMISSRMNEDDLWKQHVNCVFIRGRTAITVGHLEPLLRNRIHGQLKIDGPFKPEGYIIPIDTLRYKILKYRDGMEKDIMILIFPNVVHDHQDISTSIIDSEGMSKFKNVNSMLVTPTIIKDRAIFNQRFAMTSAVDNELTYLDQNAITGKRTIRQHYQYTMHTTNGDCGSLLVCLSNYLPKKIIGMHVAGDALGKGYAVPLNISDINEALLDVPLEAQIRLDLSRFEDESSELSEIPNGNFTPALKSKISVVSPTKTSLRPSPIQGFVLPPTTAPSVLSRRVKLEDGTTIDPLMNGLKKTGKIPPYIDEKLIVAACNDVLSLHQTNDKTRKRVLTNLEALSGVTDDPYSNPLNRSSSPGYPWIKTRFGKGKTKWTADPQGEYKMHVELEKAIEEREELALKNERYPTIWIDTLKDERRPFEKVKIGKTRVFAAGPMDFIVAFRKYYLGFCAHVAEHRIDNEIAVGINPYSYDWTHLAKHLKKKGWNIVAGDFGNFDGTLLLQILYHCGKLINDWYGDGPENAQIRDILWQEIINSIHIVGDNLYCWTHGHPSGHPLTAVLNSIYNSVVCRIVFVLCARKAGKVVTMKDFRENVSMISYGDDNVLNISDEVIEWFNQNTMTEVFATIGMEYTDELKNSASDAKPFRRLEEVSFLKRKFRYDEERKLYTAPLDYGVCMEMVNWIRGELDIELACCTNCQTSAMELSLHGREVFEKSVRMIKDACLQTMTCQPQILTYDEYVEFFESSYGQALENLILC